MVTKKKGKKDIQDQLQDVVRKEIQQMRGDNEFPEDFDSQPDKPYNIDIQADPDLEKILSSFPSTEGFYGKLYRRTPTGKHEFKYHLENLEELDDAELAVAELIRSKRWPGGEYVLRIHKRGEPGAVSSINWNIAADETQVQSGQQQTMHEQTPPANPVETLKDSIAIIQQVKEATGNDNKSLHTSMENAFSSGISIMKELMPKGDSAPKTDPSEAMMKMMPVMFEIFSKMIPQPQKQPDILEVILKAKEAGLIPSGNEQRQEKTIMEQIVEMKGVMDALGMGGGGGVGEPSATSLLITNLAPRIPEMLASIAEPIKALLELQKMKVTMGTNMGRIATPPLVTAQPTTIAHADLNPAPNPPEETIGLHEQPLEIPEESMHPVIKDIYNAVQSRDTKFYPQLETLLNTFIGAHAIPQLMTNAITIDDFLMTLSTAMGQPFLLEDNTKIYFQDFLKWKSPAPAPIPEQSSVIPKPSNGDTHHTDPVIAKCSICDMEYTYDSLANFEEDHKVCGQDNCPGLIQLVMEQASA